MLKIIINKKNRSYDEGYSAVAMVIILLLLGVGLMAELNRFSLSWQKKEIKDQHYYRNVNQVLSSIAWATTLQWPRPTDVWQCQTAHSLQLKACIRLSSVSVGNYTIIKGQSGQIKQFHLATYINGFLSLETGHWLDYCMGNIEDNCE